MSWRDARSGVAHANLPRGSRTGIAAVRPDRRPAGSPSGPVSAQRTSGYYYADYLVQAVQNGQVSETTLDTMVSRLLTQMFRFGMFDKAPTGSTTTIVTTPRTPRSRCKATRKARYC